MDEIKPTDAQIFAACITDALHGEDDKAEECIRLYAKAHAAGRKEALEEIERAWNASRLDAEEADGIDRGNWIAGFDDWLRIQLDGEK